MNHCSDEDLLLQYYGEAQTAEAHIKTCSDCASRYRELKALLDSVMLDAPERGEHYGLEVWQSIRHRLPERQSGWLDMFTLRWASAAAAAVVLVVAGFTAGRLWSPTEQPVVAGDPSIAVAAAADDDEARRRVVLLALSDHFDRSDRVLAEIMNASNPRDLAVEQAWAGDLVAASRLYRQSVGDLNEPGVAAVLEEVERVLLDVVHQPSQATAADLDDIRRRIDSAALLFKVRVITNELQHQLDESTARSTTSPSTIG